MADIGLHDLAVCRVAPPPSAARPAGCAGHYTDITSNADKLVKILNDNGASFRQLKRFVMDNHLLRRNDFTSDEDYYNVILKTMRSDPARLTSCITSNPAAKQRFKKLFAVTESLTSKVLSEFLCLTWVHIIRKKQTKSGLVLSADNAAFVAAPDNQKVPRLLACDGHRDTLFCLTSPPAGKNQSSPRGGISSLTRMR